MAEKTHDAGLGIVNQSSQVPRRTVPYQEMDFSSVLSSSPLATWSLAGNINFLVPFGTKFGIPSQAGIASRREVQYCCEITSSRIPISTSIRYLVSNMSFRKLVPSFTPIDSSRVHLFPHHLSDHSVPSLSLAVHVLGGAGGDSNTPRFALWGCNPFGEYQLLGVEFIFL